MANREGSFVMVDNIVYRASLCRISNMFLLLSFLLFWLSNLNHSKLYQYFLVSVAKYFGHNETILRLHCSRNTLFTDWRKVCIDHLQHVI